MSFNPSDYKGESKGKVTTEFKAGTQMGRIVRIVNMGLQHQTMWDGKQSKKLYWKPKEEQVKGQNNQTYNDTGSPVSNVIFKMIVEFPKVRAKDESGKEVGPAWLSKDYNPKSKKLKALLDAFGTDSAATLSGKPVMVPIGFTSGGKPKITDILPPMEGVEVAAPEGAVFVFDYYNPNKEDFDKLPKFIQDEMARALDYPGSKLEAMLKFSSGEYKVEQQATNFDDFDQDAPF